MSDQSNSLDLPDDWEAGGSESPETRALVGLLTTDGRLWQSRLSDAERVADRMRAIPRELSRAAPEGVRSVTSKPTVTGARRLSPAPQAGHPPQPGPGGRLFGLVAAIVVVALTAAVLVRLASSAGKATGRAATPTLATTPLPMHTAGPVAVPGAVGVVLSLDQTTGAHRLLLTIDGGAHWNNVVPPGTPAYGILDAYFLNAELGWAAWGPAPPRYTLLFFHTTDGGRSWRQAQVPLVSGSMPAWGTIAMAFFDAQHGWLEVGTGGTNLAYFGQLYVTSDGGAIWTQSALPFGGDMVFTAPSTGFLVGSHVSTLRNQFDMTRNGGQTWQAIHLPGVAESTQLSIGLPAFFDPQDGLVSVSNSGVDEIFATHDGGTTWTLANQQAANPQVVGNAAAILATFGTRQAWAILPATGSIVRSSDGGRTWNSVIPTPLLTGVHTLHFASVQVGWAVVGENGEILQTGDGGSSWLIVNTPS